MFILISFFGFCSFVSSFITKRDISYKFFSLFTFLLLFSCFILLTIEDGQDYIKYYELLESRISLYNAINFYSYEIIFWSIQYFLVQIFDADTWRDFNVFLIFIIPIIILKLNNNLSFHNLLLFNSVVFSFPGSYLLYGNALRQHLMVLTLLLLFSFFKRYKFLSLSSIFVHKSAILHFPFLYFKDRHFLLLFSYFILSIIIKYFNLYFVDEALGSDLLIIIVYFLFCLILTFLTKDYFFLVIFICSSFFLLVSPVIFMRLILSFGIMIGFYFTLFYSHVFYLRFFSLLVIFINLMLFFFTPLSISSLYKSILF